MIHGTIVVDRRTAKGLYGRGLDWIGRRAATSIITISDAVIETLTRGRAFEVGKALQPDRRNAGPHPSHGEEHTVRVGMFARYTPWKGHMDFLDLAERFSDQHYEFISYGNTSENDKAYFDQLRSRADALPNSDRVFLKRFHPRSYAGDGELRCDRPPVGFSGALWTGVDRSQCLRSADLAYTGGGVEELFASLNLQGERVAVGNIDATAKALRKTHPIDLDKVRFDLLEPGRYVDSYLKVCSG